MRNKKVYALSIAGFDPCGGAGVLADVQTFSYLKTQGMAVCTAITAQTDDSFHHLNWLDWQELEKQLEPLLNKYSFPFIKIGILPDEDYLNKIALKIKSIQPKAKLIWDPVIKSSTDNKIGNFVSAKIYWEHIYFATPNQIEFESLKIPNGVNYWLTGGDNEDKVGWDKLHYKGKDFILRPKTDQCYPKHGSGCMLSSAFTAYLALGYPPLKAAIRAKRFVEKRLSSNKSLLASFRK